jgi:hypothetical protein
MLHAVPSDISHVLFIPSGTQTNIKVSIAFSLHQTSRTADAGLRLEFHTDVILVIAFRSRDLGNPDGFVEVGTPV